MTRLDGYVLRHGLIALLLVSVGMLVVFAGVDALVNLNLLLAKQEPDRLAIFARLCLARLPQLLDFVIPLAGVAAGLLVAAPMLRRGEFVALGASGIGPRRATRLLLVLAAAAGALGVAIADQWTAHATATASALEDTLKGQVKGGRAWRDPDTGAAWFAGHVRLLSSERDLGRVVIATRDALVSLDRVYHDGTAWRCEGAVIRLLIGPDRRVRCDRPQRFDLSGDYALSSPPALLYRQLLPAYTMTTAELIDRDQPGDAAQWQSRLARGFLPLLMLLIALPCFVRFAHKDRIVVAAMQALCIALIPAALVLLSGIIAANAPTPAVVLPLGLFAAAAPGLWVWLRWQL